MRLPWRRGERASSLDLLVVGLGNPGPEYARHRHNVGWMVVEELARRQQASWRSKFNGRLRDELLNETLFTSLAQARVALTLWRSDYNTARPHSQIAWQTPGEFASTFIPRRSLALRQANGSAPAPVAPSAQQGETNAGNELRTG